MRFSQLASFDYFIQSCALIDLVRKGASFTWFNKYFGNQAIQYHLDLALVNVDWLQQFPCSYVLHEALLESNHLPLMMFLDSTS